MRKPAHANGLFLCPLKTLENKGFSNVFMGYRKGPVSRNGLKTDIFAVIKVLNFVNLGIRHLNSNLWSAFSVWKVKQKQLNEVYMAKSCNWIFFNCKRYQQHFSRSYISAKKVSAKFWEILLTGMFNFGLSFIFII